MASAIIEGIKAIRKAKGIKQKEMAERLNMHPVNYSKLETEETALTIDRLYQIAKILEVSIQEILAI